MLSKRDGGADDSERCAEECDELVDLCFCEEPWLKLLAGGLSLSDALDEHERRVDVDKRRAHERTPKSDDPSQVFDHERRSHDSREQRRRRSEGPRLRSQILQRQQLRRRMSSNPVHRTGLVQLLPEAVTI